MKQEYLVVKVIIKMIIIKMEVLTMQMYSFFPPKAKQFSWHSLFILFIYYSLICILVIYVYIFLNF